MTRAGVRYEAMGRRDLKHYKEVSFDFLQFVDYNYTPSIKLMITMTINHMRQKSACMELWAGEYLNYGQEFKDLNLKH